MATISQRDRLLDSIDEAMASAAREGDVEALAALDSIYADLHARRDAAAPTVH